MILNRRAKRDIRKSMSISEFDEERINKLISEGAENVQQATAIYELFILGLEVAEEEVRRLKEDEIELAEYRRKRVLQSLNRFTFAS